MLDKPTAFGRFDLDRLRQMSFDSETPVSAKRSDGLRLVVEKAKEKEKNSKQKSSTRNLEGNLFILGKPGAGKTTFLKYIAIKAAEQTIDKVPVFVSLKEWADSGLELMAYIVERFEICGFPSAQLFVEELLESGGALVLFDGLDEVNQDTGQRDKQTREMNNFVEKFDRTQCLITCRIAANDYSFQPFTYVEIADFTEKQIKTFVNNWFRNEDGERDSRTSKRFLADFAKENNKGLRDLARTPLLLTLLCLAFDETLTFPRRRVEIYEEAIDALLKKWDASRRISRDNVYRKLSRGHKENLFAQVAAKTFERNEYFIPQKELERSIVDYVKNVPPHDTNEATDGEAILKAIEAQHGIFVERARGVYSFSHLTFQEYFTAKQIVANATKQNLKEFTQKHCLDGRWREVFLLTVSLLPDASEFMTAFRLHVDEVLGSDPSLRDLLAWAALKPTSIRESSWLIRPSYLLVEFYYWDKSEHLPLAIARALDLNRERDLNLAYDFARALDRNLDLDLALARNLARLIKVGKAKFEKVEAARVYEAVPPGSPIELDFLLAQKLAQDLKQNELAEKLEELFRAARVAPVTWLEIAKESRLLMRKYRNIGHDWKLTEDQKYVLASFLNATALLEDCLELACMAPQQKHTMLKGLYLPPSLSTSKPGQAKKSSH